MNVSAASKQLRFCRQGWFCAEIMCVVQVTADVGPSWGGKERLHLAERTLAPVVVFMLQMWGSETKHPDSRKPAIDCACCVLCQS